MKSNRGRNVLPSGNIFRITKQVFQPLDLKNAIMINKKPVVSAKASPEKIVLKEPIQNRKEPPKPERLLQSVESFPRKRIIEEMEELEIPEIMKNNFVFHHIIGTGGFGKVWLVEIRRNRQSYAMKEMSKAKVITKRSVNSIMNERKLLAELKNSFLVNMVYAFQDRDNLYLVMDLMSGGDLRYHVGRMRRFSEEQTKFFVACVVIGLEYLHLNGILHRDIKPENLVLDQNGYVRITDFGIARRYRQDNAEDTSGTPGYMAPEVMCHQNHSIEVDYFALGVMTYEFMMGRRPYVGKSRKEIRDHILSKQVQIKPQDIPPDWSLEAADFINRLIQRKAVNRLGVNGPAEIKAHPWLKGVPWQKIYRKELEAPYLPSQNCDNFDSRMQNEKSCDEATAELIKQNALLLRRDSVQNLFKGYYYDKEAGIKAKTKPSLVNSSSIGYINQSTMGSTNESAL